MKRPDHMFAVLALSVTFSLGCLRTSSTCETSGECFGDEQCVNQTCVFTPSSDSCEVASCKTEGVAEVGCFDSVCYVERCEESFVPCEQGCCEPSQPSGDIPFEEQGFIAEPDLVIDKNGFPSIVWSDNSLLRLNMSVWTGTTWQTKPIEVTPSATPFFDFDYDSATGFFNLAYLSVSGDIWIAQSENGEVWKTVRALTGPPIDPEDPLSYTLVNLNVIENEPVVCAVFGNEDIILGFEDRDGLPSMHLAYLTLDNEWEQITHAEGETVLTCEAAIDLDGALHAAYSTFDDPITTARYAFAATPEEGLEPVAWVSEYSIFGARDTFALDGEQKLHTVFTLFDEPVPNQLEWQIYDVRWSDGRLVTSQVARVRSVSDVDGILGPTLAGADGRLITTFTHFQRDTETAAYFGEFNDGLWNTSQLEPLKNHDYFVGTVSASAEHFVYTSFGSKGLFYVVQ